MLKRIGMIGAELGFPELERFLEERQGQVQLTGIPISHGKVVHARERVGMIRAEMLFAQRERALQESDRSLVRAHTAIGVPTVNKSSAWSSGWAGKLASIFASDSSTAARSSNSPIVGLVFASAAGAGLEQGIGLRPHIGLAQQLVFQEVFHRDGDLLLLFGLLLFGFDLHEPLTGQLFTRKSTPLLVSVSSRWPRPLAWHGLRHSSPLGNESLTLGPH